MSIETAIVAGDLRLLARGPVATVYLGRAAGAGAEFAVKMFPGGFDRDTSAWLDHERKALATVRSTRSILQIEDVVTSADGHSGVRRELCQGSLAGLLGSGVRLAVRDVLALGSALAAALAAAHQVGVLHGGVTPHNVLYRANGEFVLADFGLALRRRFPRDPMYAVEYTAPETLRDDTLSAASDLYGLGVVLYAVLTGAPPFPRRTGQQSGERILQVLREEVPPVRGPQVPAELSDAVGRLLAKDPADRPRDAAAMVELFENLRRAVDGPMAAPVPGHSGEAHDVEAAHDDEDDPEVEFDDFAQPGPAQPGPATAAPAQHDVQPVLPAEPAMTPPVPMPPAGRTLVRTFGGAAPSGNRKLPRIRRRTGVLVGTGVIVVGLVAATLVIGLAGSAEQTGSASTATPVQPSQWMPGAEAVPDVHLELSPPADLGDHVQLTWRADGDLDFAVVVAGERIDTMVLAAHRQRTMEVPVDPARRYCFQVRATDSRHTYTSEPLPIRGSRCTL